MRRFFLFPMLSFALSLPAYAAETGTYRAGQAYNSITASSPVQCAAQCAGDAQCKGWNFVRPRQMSRTGVCEFNARAVSPVPSPISVSGNSEMVRQSARIISGGTNTITVGSPAPQIIPAPVQRPVPRPVQPVRMQAYAAPHQMPSPPRAVPVQAVQNERPAPRLQYSLEGARMMQARRPMPVMAGARPAPAPVNAYPNISSSPALPAPRLQYSLEGSGGSFAQPAYAADARRPETRPQAQPQVFAQPQPTAPQTPPPGTLVYKPYVPPPAKAPPSPAAMGTGVQTGQKLQVADVQMPPPAERLQHKSLFGSLHDDVQIPLTLTRENMPTDPDAPIATVRSVRTKPVETSALSMLAGAPRF